MNSIKIFIAVLFVALIGCAKDDHSIEWEVSLDSANPSIEGNIEDIVFKFCLLDEKGNPSTKFKEGENFNFYFSMTNKRNKEEHLCLDNEFLSSLTGFCEVITYVGDTIGFPYKNGLCELVGSGAHPFVGENTHYELIIPWEDRRSNWSTLHWSFESADRQPLPIGKYYTRFTHKFRFARAVDESSLFIGPVTFRINFEIQ